MRHGKKVNHLGRTASHRDAMLSNMASSLIINKRITTTTAKARSLRKYLEPLITKSKQDTTHSRRTVFSYLQNKVAAKELFDNISIKVMDRPGGYTRILKTGFRHGDSAEMCIIELVDYSTIVKGYVRASDAATAAPKRRTRRSSSKVAAATAATDAE